MKMKIKDLTTDELRTLIVETIRETMDELTEDIAALSSDSYIESIETARQEYREGKVKNFEEISDT